MSSGPNMCFKTTMRRPGPDATSSPSSTQDSIAACSAALIWVECVWVRRGGGPRREGGSCSIWCADGSAMQGDVVQGGNAHTLAALVASGAAFLVTWTPSFLSNLAWVMVKGNLDGRRCHPRGGVVRG